MPARHSPQIDNAVYDQLANTWWDERGLLHLLKSSLSPWRVPYFRRILAQRGITPQGQHALDVGCGGGLLAEEIAAMGFAVTGVDPSEASLAAARAHAALAGLRIDYQRGHAGALPFADATFDIAWCCDVLEHVPDWGDALGEIARVLKPGGVFFYDTINRTFVSRIVVIDILQAWPATRIFPANLHVWRMFITPAELRAGMERHGLRPRDARGTWLSPNPLQAFQTLHALHQYQAGRISSRALGERLHLREGPIMAANYMGYAVKES